VNLASGRPRSVAGAAGPRSATARTGRTADDELVGHGRDAGLRTANSTAVAAGRHRRSDAAVRQREAVSQRHPSLLQRHGMASSTSLTGPKSASLNRHCRLHHFDLKHLPPWSGAKAMPSSPSTAPPLRLCRNLPRRDAKTSAGFLKRFLAHFPHRVHTILTDNGAEFTDRFAVDMKNSRRASFRQSPIRSRLR